MIAPSNFADLLRCPVTGEPLVASSNGSLANVSGTCRYAVNEMGIPLLATKTKSTATLAQERHFDAHSQSYVQNLSYPHTEEYLNHIYDTFLATACDAKLDCVAEICCGDASLFRRIASRLGRGIGIDISQNMLEVARSNLPAENILFVQGDALSLPLASGSFDSVFMQGGIHHVSARDQLFSEVLRILKPGGCVYWLEPLNDFFLWRALRWVIYRLSPGLDHRTESPLRFTETARELRAAGLDLEKWHCFGFIGFCLFMNSDILVFNRLFRFVPGIRSLVRLVAKLDTRLLSLPTMRNVGLLVTGSARKPTSAGAESN